MNVSEMYFYRLSYTFIAFFNSISKINQYAFIKLEYRKWVIYMIMFNMVIFSEYKNIYMSYIEHPIMLPKIKR